MTFLVVFISTKASDVVTGQAGLIERFVENSELMLKEYASAADIKKLLSQPDNPEYIDTAQNHNLR